ncbi:Sushi, von Willebrand factor type A, EGF and pentraxin domain-containing protein 1, partial [Stegodyphus mimosarum]
MNKTKAQVFIILAFLLYRMSSADEKEEDAILHYLNNSSFVQGKAELVFLLDRSGSIGAANFEEEKGFVESFLTHIVVDVNATRVAVISYSDTAERHIDFLREPKSKCFLSQELQDVVFKNSGATNTAAAIEEAALVFENARPNVNKVIILITDGFSNKGGDPVPHAVKLKQKGVQIFAFGIGRFLKTELQSLATSPNHAFSSSDFKEFKRLARKIRGDPHEVSWSGQASQPNCDHLCESPYKGDPNDPGCCDHDARCSCALLSGMHTCVCGPGYYGLSGLMGQCRACPRGTYKSKLEPTRSCTPCPPGATTAELASTSVNDCYCKDGYFGDPSSKVPCTLVKCPPLQKPTNGFIVGSCESTYGSTCFFMCEDGYELVDQRDDTRTCESNGKWTRNTAVCRKVICPALQKPRFGNKVCDSGMLTVGKRCRFSCWEGYIMQ